MKNYYLKQKVFSFKDKYKIYDDQQNVVFYCDAKLFSINHKMTFMDAKTNEPIYYFKRKIFSIMPEYQVNDYNHEFVAKVRKKFKVMSKKVVVNTPKDTYDIEGNFYAHSFGIMHQSSEITTVRKKYLSWGDSYEISVSDDIDDKFMVALVVLVDSIFHNKKKKSQ